MKNRIIKIKILIFIFLGLAMSCIFSNAAEAMTCQEIPDSFSFTKYLYYDNSNNDPTEVKYLQIILNTDSETKLADSGSGSPGNETTYFGLLTKAAVIKFQIKYEIIISEDSYGAGYVGPQTREKLNIVLGNCRDAITFSPNLISPQNNSHQNSSITFQWSNISNASKYKLFVKLPGNSSWVSDETTATSYPYAPTLIGVYCWKVKSYVNGEWSDYSEEWTFYFDGTPAPSLISPLNNSETTVLRPTFQWNSVSGSNYYELQLAKDNSFTDMVRDNLSIHGTSWKLVNQDLTVGQTYYWRVRSSLPIGHWSNIWHFAVTENQPPPQQKCTNGTFYSECSITKPSYCDNGTLIPKCSLCGCPSGQICKADGSCDFPPTCSDGIKNGDETGIDCGGSCPPCEDYCSGDYCGGACPSCDYGKSCAVNSDCQDGLCKDNICSFNISISDSPDPFNPYNGETNTITISTNGNLRKAFIFLMKDKNGEDIIRGEGDGISPNNPISNILPYEWDGRDKAGNIVSPGIYDYTLTAYAAYSDYSGFQETINGTITVLGPTPPPENQRPNLPNNVSPENGATDINPNSYELKSSSFSDSDGDSHIASQWQVRKSSENYNNSIVDIYSDSHLTKIPIPLPQDPTSGGKLEYETEYFWRVKYKDSYDWSEWSNETFFTTKQNEEQPPELLSEFWVEVNNSNGVNIYSESRLDSDYKYKNIPINFAFLNELKEKQTNDDIKSLQIMLNSDPATCLPADPENPQVCATSGDGSPGNETTYFGIKTKKAVIKFQIEHKIIKSKNDSSASIVGPKTREKLNELLGIKKHVMHKWILERVDSQEIEQNGYVWWHMREAKYNENDTVTGWVIKKYVKEVKTDDLVPSYMSYHVDYEEKIDSVIEWAEIIKNNSKPEKYGETDYKNVFWENSKQCAEYNSDNKCYWKKYYKEDDKCYTTYCLRFVKEAFNYPSAWGGWNSAEDLRKYLSDQKKFYGYKNKDKNNILWNPPKGALMFYSIGGTSSFKEYGHVGIHTGDGKVVHIYNSGKPIETSIESMPHLYNTTPLSYLGWALPEELFKSYTFMENDLVGFSGERNLRSERLIGNNTVLEKPLKYGDYVKIISDEKNGISHEGYYWWKAITNKKDKEGKYTEGWFAESSTVKEGKIECPEELDENGWCVKDTVAIIKLNSPGDIQVYDFQGRVSGLVDGEIVEDIPNSIYDEENHTVVIFFASPDSYFYKVVGTNTGTYGLTITSIENGEEIIFNATDISTTPNQVHEFTVDWQALSQGEEGVTMKIDVDGDGEFEQEIISDGELTQEEYLSNIPKQIKQSTIAKLESAKTGNRKIDKEIDRAIKHINKSLEDKLWIDDFHLNPKYGRKVFREGDRVVSRLYRMSKRMDNGEGLKQTIDEVIQDLIKSDKLLSEIALSEAKNISVENSRIQKRIDREIKRAEREMERAEKELERGRMDRVIDRFGKAWQYAQKAILKIK